MKSRWGIYLKERFPLIPNILVAWGMILSCARLALPAGAPLPHLEFAVGFVGAIVFLAQLRFMDELKDVEKDKIAHPDRPLPRGLFTTAEFARWIVLFQSVMIALAIATGLLLNPTAGIFFGVGTVYLYLMYREFFLPSLARSPFLYAITHQAITVPMLGFGVALFAPDFFRTPEFGWFSMLLVSAFFAFEIGRKLDPRAHPLLTTYLVVYGRMKTVSALGILLSLLVVSAVKLGLGIVFIPLGGIALLSLSLVFFAPEKFKWIEAILTVVLLASLWTVPFVGRG